MRVYITGIGMVSPLGVGRENTWSNILSAENVESLIPQHWNNYTDYHSGIWAPLPDINYLQHGFKRAETLQYDDTTLLAIIASQEALQHASLDIEVTDKKRNQFQLAGLDSQKIAVIYGTGSGGARSIFDSYSHHANSLIKRKLLENSQSEELSEIINELHHPKILNPFSISRSIANSTAAGLGIKFSVHGEVKIIVQACSAGTAALGDTYNLIKSGKYDLVISGGAEQLADHTGAIYHGFDMARTLAVVGDQGNIYETNRPFDINRSGFLFAQGGAASLIIESEKSVEARGVEPLAEITGYAETFDGSSLMAPNPSGDQMERMIMNALSDANISPEEVDYVNAHGTGTQLNDEVEASVLKRVFGEGVAINSTKSMLGHTFGASGAIEASICALSMRDNVLHQSKNLVSPIDDLDFILENRSQKIKYALSESFAFGGHNTGLILKNPR